MGALCSFKFKPHFHRGICKVQNWLVSFFFFSCSFLHSLEFWKWMGQIRSFCIKEILVLFSPNDCFQPCSPNFLPLGECLADPITFQSIWVVKIQFRQAYNSTWLLVQVNPSSITCCSSFHAKLERNSEILAGLFSWGKWVRAKLGGWNAFSLQLISRLQPKLYPLSAFILTSPHPCWRKLPNTSKQGDLSEGHNNTRRGAREHWGDL